MEKVKEFKKLAHNTNKVLNVADKEMFQEQMDWRKCIYVSKLEHTRSTINQEWRKFLKLNERNNNNIP